MPRATVDGRWAHGTPTLHRTGRGSRRRLVGEVGCHSPARPPKRSVERPFRNPNEAFMGGTAHTPGGVGRRVESQDPPPARSPRG